MSLKLVRMIRNRIIAALGKIDDWRVGDGIVTRLDDGLWVKFCYANRDHYFEVGNSDHDVAQIVIPSDAELQMAFNAVKNFHHTVQRKRSITKNLGMDE